jgi:4-aminobutyrate aminotransferase-like enzyme
MTSDLLSRRAAALGGHVPTFYRQPLEIVRGAGVHVWDVQGRQYLDCYNNVPHVGHCHPRVVEAIAQQAATLNTHTRYLHPMVVEYVERLCAKFDHGLTQAIMVCTGSEANDVALRMAQAATGARGVIATDATYHGNTSAVSALSTRRPPIGGYPPHVRLVPAPEAGMTGAEFAANVADAIAELEAAGEGFSGLMLCPFFANEAFPTVAPGFLRATERVVRGAGGLIMADEVQPGFGRLGSHWWGHDWIGLVPDIVTLGKPMANGHPVAAVVTRPDIMEAFRSAFGYFNTFGGNPVSSAAALATLDVIEDEALVQNAATVGPYVTEMLRGLDHPFLHEVRGAGLFFGIEFRKDGAPATDFVAEVVEQVVARGVLLNKIGRHGEVLKMRPPMPFSHQNAEHLVQVLDDALKATPLDA